jgi:monofunctional biosynthetic peptidoglycan transglycosylase
VTTRIDAPEPAPPRKRKSLKRRLIGWIVKAVLAFFLGSLLWVAALRFINPPITFTMIGDAVSGHGVTKSWMSLEPDRSEHGPRRDRRGGFALLRA